ncbi:MAG: type VI secretion protein, partial [Sphingobium sp.]|nr:type VI secretion protein [Sphingobium sp.]
MSRDDNEFRVRPGRSRDSGAASGRRSQKLAAQVQRAANKAGHAGSRRAGLKRGSGSGKAARGRRTVAAMRRTPGQRRVTVMARIARHKGAHYRAAPLAKHIKYLERDGVSRDGRDASMFDAQTDRADRDAFAGRCEDDRHHFRFIVSPEDAGDMEDLRSFTRELMADAAKDLGTELDWVAVDHWNTDNPHIHVLVRGVA